MTNEIRREESILRELRGLVTRQDGLLERIEDLQGRLDTLLDLAEILYNLAERVEALERQVEGYADPKRNPLGERLRKLDGDILTLRDRLHASRVL
jgi:hypothetical protein